MIQKSYDKKPKVFIVPTPIGNLKDITERAKDTLAEVSAIFAEDTRVTLELLNLLGIKNKIYTCQKFTEAKSTKQILSFLNAGKDVALVTDRGTPLISDPGSVVVKNIIDAGYNVVALPGPCAFVPALNMSGLEQDKFLFYGFLSSKEQEAINELKKLLDVNFTIILYEAPHRLLKTLKNVYKVFGNINLSISREISKVHEEVFRGTVTEAIEAYKDVKGEIVIVLEKKSEEINYVTLLSDVYELINLGVKSSDAIKYVAKKNDASRNLLYNIYEEAKNEINRGIG